MDTMTTRYRLMTRGSRGGTFYCVDKTTGKRTSLKTADADEAQQIIEAKNQAERQPVLNLQIAKAYLAGTDNSMTTRTWQDALAAVIDTKLGDNKHRWRTFGKDKALVSLLRRPLLETSGEHLLQAMKADTTSTNVFLRRLHSFCVDMNWLPWPFIPKRQWPAVKFKGKRASNQSADEQDDGHGTDKGRQEGFHGILSRHKIMLITAIKAIEHLFNGFDAARIIAGAFVRQCQSALNFYDDVFYLHVAFLCHMELTG
jgi:hypothetical protein